MYDGPPLCDRCMECVKQCYTSALDGEKLEDVRVGDRTFAVARKDIWRCMWSKRFMLLARAGPDTYGLDVTVEPPEGEITEEDVQEAQARKGREGGMQTWYSYADRACERACVPPHMRNNGSADSGQGAESLE